MIISLSLSPDEPSVLEHHTLVLLLPFPTYPFCRHHRLFTCTTLFRQLDLLDQTLERSLDITIRLGAHFKEFTPQPFGQTGPFIR